jgi:hypothetical protein
VWSCGDGEFRGQEQGFAVVDLAGPEAGPIVVPGEEQTARNAIAVVVGPDYVEFRINDETVTTFPRAEIDVDGVTGYRVGAGLNLHLISFAVRADGQTTEWAPQPAETSEEGGA